MQKRWKVADLLTDEQKKIRKEIAGEFGNPMF